MQPQLGIWKRLIRSLSSVDICSLSWRSRRGLLEVISCGQMQTQLGIWKRLIRSLLVVGQNQLSLRIWKRLIIILLVADKCSLSWGYGRGFLVV